MNSLKRRKPASPRPQSQSYPHPHIYSEDIAHTNTDSPFFRLPPEIRNRIYTLVLGVGHVHIRYRPWNSRAASRSNTATATAITPKKSGFYAIALPADADPWGRACKNMMRKIQTGMTSKTAASTPGKTSTASVSAGYSTALVQVCRQIHTEAALLPFSLNAWSFESTHIMERYLVRDRRLALAQRRAMRVLVVADDLPSRSIERYLGGLRVVVWRDASTKTFERWELPLQKAKAPTRSALLLFD
ncbi:hypothetical protein F503_00697 [Ophiostoma piceae UAMH 11346]|uniref:DUF7730 domain-containing protein n=1 Tax=Ophiostoma piceae (strain UAMH 11346) TaxID=1262450 RepID=S3BMJ2_OPHP1|nr:hypothetical protein F503_00697 [Ophiostoma piceae UAMH 11346]